MDARLSRCGGRRGYSLEQFVHSVAAVLPAVVVLLMGSSAGATVPDKARHLMAEGAEKYEAGEYEAAADIFEDAFEIHPDARFLFNAGRASQRAGAQARAYRYYRHALAADSGESRLEEQEQGTARGFVAGVSGQFAAERTAMAMAEWPEFEEVRFSGRGRLGTAIASTGILLGSAAIVAGWRAETRISDLRSGGVDSIDGYQKELDSIERTQRWGRWSLYGGVGMIGAGSALVVWDMMTVDEIPATKATMTASPNGVWIGWEVGFE